MFQRLADAPNAETAQAVEVQIRRIWSATGDSDLDRIMSAGQTAMVSGELGRALSLFDALIAQRPDHAEAHLRRAQVLITMRDLDRAEADIDIAVSSEPRHFRALATRHIRVFHQH